MYREVLFLVLALVFALNCNAQNPSQLYGLDFSPYLSGQDPNLNTQIGATQIQSRMQIVAPYTRWIRSFSGTAGLENTPSVARQLGLKVAANAWISSNPTQNNTEIANLIAAANAGLVDIAIVGSEALLRNDVSESQLIAYMNQVRQAIPKTIPVTTADTYGTLIAHPNVIGASDIVFGNFYPYWEGISIDNAICALAQQYQRLVVAAGGKQVVISETGWPSAGNAVGAAIPSPGNSAQYFLQFVSWASGKNIPYFYFEAFDENWKAAYEGPQGAHWGIWDSSGLLKPGMQAVFNGQTSPVTCDGTIGGPGTPAISFVYVPPYGSSSALEGQVLHVSPASYGVAVYIKVGGGWWTKPTFAQSVTAIQVDGTWAAPIVTGGIDQLATDIAAFLIPLSFSPPLLSGAGTLPDSLTTNSVARAQVQRTQNSISGVVTDSLNHPAAGVTISGSALGAMITAPDGRYSFFNLPAFGTATLTPSYPNVVFTPPSITLSITSGNQVANFTAASTVDLSVTSTLSANSVSLGSKFMLTAVVSNAGIAAASDAIATISMPGSTPLSASSTRGACGIANQQITCDVGGLAPTAYATITVVATASVVGSFTISASVAGPDPDSNPGNNISDQALIVLTGTGPFGLRFVPVAPCRVSDTRRAPGPFGGPSIAGGTVRGVTIPAGACGIPSNAAAYSLNVTVVPSGPLGYLTLWPAGQAQPFVSTLNSFDGRIKANAAIVPAGANGAVSIFVTDTTDVVLDINGYFVPTVANSSLVFYSVAPCRVADTRAPIGPFGGPSMLGGQARSFIISNANCGIPSTALAFSLNMTVVPSGPLSYLTTWPAGQPQPFVSTLNAQTGTVTANAAIVPAGNAAISVFVTDPTDVVIDINGYFAPPGSPGELLLYSVNPCRISDTRLSVGPLGGPSMTAGQSRVFPVTTGACGLPSTAKAYSLNATVVPKGALGYLTLWPSGQAQPLVSTLNSFDGSVVANAAIVPAGASGSVSAYVTDLTDLILDVSGYFAP